MDHHLRYCLAVSVCCASLALLVTGCDAEEAFFCNDVTLYPGAKVSPDRDAQAAELMEQLEAIGPEGKIAAYVTGDEPEAVQRHYAEALPDGGWEFVLEVPGAEGGVSIWRQGDRSVQVLTARDRGQTLILLGCGPWLGGDTGPAGQADAEAESPQESQPEVPEDAPSYGLGEPVSFDGGTWTFESVETLDRIPVRFEDEFYAPDNGQYIVISYHFQGDAANNAAGIDQAIYRLVDDQGRSHSIDSDLWNHEISELSGIRDRFDGLFLMWNNPEPKKALLVFDVPTDAQGLELHFLYSEEGQVRTGARVVLGEPTPAVE